MADAVEVIDSSKMQVLTEFAAAGFVHNNHVRFRIGVVGSDVIIASCSPSGEWSADVLFERANAPAAASLLDDVLKGRLRKEGREYVSFAAGKDRVGVGAQMPRDRMTISIYNHRRASMDGYEASTWCIYVAPDTALSISVELKELLAKGIL